MTKYVTMQRPRRRLSFWQRTLWVFVAALIVMALVLAFLYSQSFSLAQFSDAPATTEDAVIPLPPTAMSPTTEAAVAGGSSWLFDAPVPAAETATPTEAQIAAPQELFPTTDSATPTTALPTVTVMEVAALNERPELLRDLRLSEQSLDEDEPRVAMELLLALARNYPTFRPDEVAQRLYEAYLALGDQAMRREARSEAVGYYNQAGSMAVAEQTGLLRRREAIARLFPNLRALPQTEAQTGPEITAPVAIDVEIATPTALPVVSTQAETDPTPTPVPPTVIAVAPVCPDDHIALTAPTVNAQVRGSVAVAGSVKLEELWYYKLEWAAAGSSDFAYFGGAERTVENNVLGRLDTTALPDGDYLIRVTVVDQTGNYPPPCEVAVTVAN